MNEPQSLPTSESPEFVPCIDCHELIPVGAKKCKHCHSFQGWSRRLLGLANMTLPLLVALVSVIASLQAVRTVTPQEALRVTAHVSNAGIQGGIETYVVNAGTASGTLKRDAIVIVTDAEKKVIHKINHFFNPASGNSLGALTLDPHDERTFYLSSSHANQGYPELQDDYVCTLHYLVQSAAGNRDATVSFNCW